MMQADGRDTDVLRGVYVEIDTANVLTYMRPAGAVFIIFIGTVCLCTIPGDDDGALLIRYEIPFVSMVAAMLIEKLPSINNIIDVITRHTLTLWIFHVVYSMVFRQEVLLGTMASFTCSSAAIAGSFLLEWTYDKFDNLVRRYKMQQLSVFFMMAMVLLPHERATLRFDHVLEFALRTVLFVAFVGVDLISALLLRDRVEPYSFFICKWWIFYVHPWLLPILLLAVIKIGMRRAELAVEIAQCEGTDLEAESESDEQVSLVINQPGSANEQRYSFTRPRKGLLTQKWEDRKIRRGPPIDGEIDVSRLVELSEVASIGSKSV